MRGGQVLHVLSASGSKGVFPRVETLNPICVLDSAPDTITITGTNISAQDNFVLCRCQGMLCVMMPSICSTAAHCSGAARVSFCPLRGCFLVNNL